MDMTTSTRTMRMRMSWRWPMPSTDWSSDAVLPKKVLPPV